MKDIEAELVGGLVRVGLIVRVWADSPGMLSRVGSILNSGLRALPEVELFSRGLNCLLFSGCAMKSRTDGCEGV